MHLKAGVFIFEKFFFFQMHNLPPKANSYIKSNFEKDSLQTVKEICDKHGREVFEVVICCEEAIYTLHFNRTGDLVFYSTKLR
jgi:phosphoribosyl-ATP pyrophosphohydrolase